MVIQSCNAIGRAGQALVAAQAETDKSTAVVETIVANLRRSRTLARQQRSVDAHNAALTPWRTADAPMDTPPAHRSTSSRANNNHDTATNARPSPATTRASGNCARHAAAAATRKKLAREIMHLVREGGVDITSPEQVRGCVGVRVRVGMWMCMWARL